MWLKFEKGASPIKLQSYGDLPCWSSAVQKVFLVQPSSAAAERVFSLLKNAFGEQQQSSLQDLVAATCKLMVQ